MTMELIGAGGMTDELKETYNRRMLSVLVKNLVYANYGRKDGIPTRGGKSIEWRRFERLTVGSHILTEGTPPTATTGTISKVEATVSQYGAYAQLSDLLETQSFDPLLDAYAQEFGRQMAEELDMVVRDVVTATTTVQYAGAATAVGTSVSGAVGSGDYLSAAELLEAKRTLARVDARPINGRYICLLHPDNTKDLFQDPDIVEAFETAAADRGSNNPLATGILGDWMGIRFVETSALNKASSYGMSGADVYDVMLIADEAYGVTQIDALAAQMIIHPRGTGGHTDPLEQYSTVGWKASLAAKILDQNRLVKIYCASSKTPAA